MPIFWRRFLNYRKQKRLNKAYWDALHKSPPDFDELSVLLQAGAEVNGGKEGWRGEKRSALSSAVSAHWWTTETVRFLIENGADILRTVFMSLKTLRALQEVAAQNRDGSAL